jgi:hypothetical protein
MAFALGSQLALLTISGLRSHVPVGHARARSDER